MALDIILQARRNQEAAETLLGRLLEWQPREPRVIVTDKPAGYVPAIKKVFPDAEHRALKGRNNRAENSHQLTAGGSGHDGGSSRPPTHTAS